MGEAIEANLISWLIIVGLVLLIVTFRVGVALLWLEIWSRIYPEAREALHFQYEDETDIDDHVQAIGRGMLFVLKVPRMARDIAEAERDPRTRTALPLLAVEDIDQPTPEFVRNVLGLSNLSDVERAEALMRAIRQDPVDARAVMESASESDRAHVDTIMTVTGKAFVSAFLRGDQQKYPMLFQILDNYYRYHLYDIDK